MIILKLGGSVITNKTTEGSFRENIMDNLSKEIKKANKQIILIHGAGSYGHIYAKKYRLNQGFKKDEQIHGFSVTQEMVQRLNSMVLKSLQKNGIPAVSIAPHSILKLNDNKFVSMNYNVIKEYLKKQFTPVTFGDVVLDEKLGFSICSGDLLVMELTKFFKPKKVVFVLDEDGIYTSNPKIDKNAKLIEETNIYEIENLTTTANDHADVTKGMQGKIETIKNISSLNIDTVLLNGNINNRLYDTLVGKKTKCTLVYGEK